jgi:hypothetical protein
LEQLVSALDPQQLTAPALRDGWSVKDSLAHLADWELMMFDWVAAYRRGDEPTFWMPGFEVDSDESDDRIDDLNIHLYEKNKDLPLDEVLDTFREAFLRSVDLVGSMGESELFDPDRFPSRSGRPLVLLIAGATFEHYDEHIEEIRAFVEAQASEY